MATKLSGETVDNMLYDIFEDFVEEDKYTDIVIIADKNYETIESTTWIKQQISGDPTLSKDRYRKDIFDCDDYVIYLKSKLSLLYSNNKKYSCAACIGYIMTNRHAFNLMVDDNEDVIIVNTQSNNIDCLNASGASTVKISNFLDINANNRILHIYI